MNGLPEGEEFMKYLQQWLASPTTRRLPACWAGFVRSRFGFEGGWQRSRGIAFQDLPFPTAHPSGFHTLDGGSSSNFGGSFCEDRNLYIPLFLHYVYFDQYLRIIGITKELLGLGLASVLIVTALLLGSWRTGLIVTGVVGLTIVSVMGVMGVWGINLNAVSLVNLVISLGIAVEFCAHVARAFMNVGSGLPVDHPSGQKERDERMGIALVDVGPSVSCFGQSCSGSI
jgi:Niemann-Pick C1 protein